VGGNIDAVVAVTDRLLMTWVRRVWEEAGLRLEPSAAAGFAALEPFMREAGLCAPSSLSPVHVVWATGGSLLPRHEFAALFE